MVMHEFDRVFYRDDMAAACLVDFVDDAGECGRLAVAGRPCHEHEPLLEVGAAHDLFGDVARGGIGKPELDDAQHRGKRVALVVHVEPEAPDARDGKREVVVGVRDFVVVGDTLREHVDGRDVLARHAGREALALGLVCLANLERHRCAGDEEHI